MAAAHVDSSVSVKSLSRIGSVCSTVGTGNAKLAGSISVRSASSLGSRLSVVGATDLMATVSIAGGTTCETVSVEAPQTSAAESPYSVVLLDVKTYL